MPRSKFDVMRDEMKKGYADGKRTKVPRSERTCFQMHVAHHVNDLHMSEKQAVAAAYSEERAGKLKGVCKIRKVS